MRPTSATAANNRCEEPVRTIKAPQGTTVCIYSPVRSDGQRYYCVVEVRITGAAQDWVKCEVTLRSAHSHPTQGALHLYPSCCAATAAG